MRMTSAVDDYLHDMRAEGRINSDVSEYSYRQTLAWHAEDVNNRDPRYTNRTDIKATLDRWPNPNTRAKRLAYLKSFYRWLQHEGLRKDNPADQVRPPKMVKPSVYKMTLAETIAFLEAAHTPRERRAAFLLVCAGLRNREARGMQVQHFERPGFVHVSKDIAKRGVERWVPIIEELQPIVDEIRTHVRAGEWVLASVKVADPGINKRWMDDPSKPCSQQYLGSLVADLGLRAGIKAHIHPHLLRHAFASHVARSQGVDLAQAVLGHGDISTTQGYLNEPSLDELATAMGGVSFLGGMRTHVLPLGGTPVPPASAPGRIRTCDPDSPEPESGDDENHQRAVRSLGRFLTDLRDSPVIRQAVREL